MSSILDWYAANFRLGSFSTGTSELRVRSLPLRPESDGRAAKCAPAAGLTAPKHAAENRVDVGEVKVEVEIGLQIRCRKVLADLLVRRKEREEIAFTGPRLHRVALHKAIGVLARHALL